MSDIAIKVENLSKKYLLGTAASGNLRDTLANSWNSLVGKTKKGEKKEFWALKDVSFEVKKGEIIGVIGRNGAGKSTLLKILSRITEPTSGRIELNGRVSSLLEVGTGFHPELSGRENIFLNGALLGMTRAEIKRKFDEIIDFSGVEEFIDTPVKKYSSGMYVRLAFAVAAHLEPEILLIDEVLAVGDAEFQKKCLGKMGEVAKGGRTVIFVSHDMKAVQRICQKGLMLNQGKLIINQQIEKTIRHYLNQFAKSGRGLVKFHENADKAINIIESAIINADGNIQNQLKFGEPFSISITTKVNQPVRSIPTIGIESYTGNRVLTANGVDANFAFKENKDKIVEIKANFDTLTLTPGKYQVLLRITAGRGIILDQQLAAISFEVIDIAYKDTPSFEISFGLIRIIPEWSIQTVNPSKTLITE